VTSRRPDPEDQEAGAESGRELIELGSETLASVTGAAAGSFLGPPGALAGAAAGPSIARAVAWAGRTMKSRLLSANEEARIGTALYVALERFKEREDAGEKPRKDGFFEPGGDPRGALEGALLAAARSYDEKKVPFVGAFYASFVFDERVSIAEAHFMLTLLDRLTYQQFCAMSYFADPGSQAEREQIQLAAEEENTPSSPALLSELFELANLGLLGARQGDPAEVRSFGETYATFGGGIPIVARQASRLALTSLGGSLARMAELHKIPDADKEAIGSKLRGTA
jgi:hypothetical protein